MYDFAFEKPVAVPATEDLVEQSINTTYSDNVSEQAVRWMTTETVTAIMTVFRRRMALRGLDIEEAKKLVREASETMRRNGDIDKYDFEYLNGENFWSSHVGSAVNDPKRWNRGVDDCDSLWSMVMYVRNIASGSTACNTSYSKELLAKLPENERVIIETVKKKREELWEAESVMEKYFEKKANNLLSYLFNKYGDVLSKLDEELYNYIYDEVKPRQDEAVPADPTGIPV